MLLIVNTTGMLGVLIGAFVAAVVGLSTRDGAAAFAAFGLVAGGWAALTDRYPGGFRFGHLGDVLNPAVRTAARIAIFGVPLIVVPYAVLTVGSIACAVTPESRTVLSFALLVGQAVVAFAVTVLTRRRRCRPARATPVSAVGRGLSRRR